MIAATVSRSETGIIEIGRDAMDYYEFVAEFQGELIGKEMLVGWGEYTRLETWDNGDDVVLIAVG